MSKSAMVRARMEPELKKHTEEIFRRLGLSVTQAITLFYMQVEARNGLPFNVGIPNSETLKTFETTDAGEDLAISKDADEMFEKLGIVKPARELPASKAKEHSFFGMNEKAEKTVLEELESLRSSRHDL